MPWFGLEKQCELGDSVRSDRSVLPFDRNVGVKRDLGRKKELVPHEAWNRSQADSDTPHLLVHEGIVGHVVVVSISLRAVVFLMGFPVPLVVRRETERPSRLERDT